MALPKISVVIPVFNGAAHIGAAIRSVLAQTLPDLELIVVNDGCTDATPVIVAGFADPRLTLIAHRQNRGVYPARNTGIRAARADVVAFLDHDDLFHPEKLRAHHDFLRAHPEVGFTYNARFELDYSRETVRGIWRPAAQLSLADFVLGFPVSPSDMVIRRPWLETIGAWDETHGFLGGEFILAGRLCLARCVNARVDGALNYRRYHSGRVYNVEESCHSELAGQEKILSDPRCPPDVVARRPEARSHTYRAWAIQAFLQHDITLGREFMRQALRLDPSIRDYQARAIEEQLIEAGIRDASVDHAQWLRNVCAQLPEELASLAARAETIIQRASLHAVVRAAIWEGAANAERGGSAAPSTLDERFLGKVAHQLLDYEAVYDGPRARAALGRVANRLGSLAGRRLTATYWAARAFQRYQEHRYRAVPASVAGALVHDPRYLRDRGLLAIGVRALARMLRPQVARAQASR